MKAKILLILLAVVIGLMIAQSVYSQDLAAAIRSKKADIVVIQNDERNAIANKNCDNVITAYQESDEDMDRIVSNLDRSWYYGMNLFIAKDLWTIVATIQNYNGYYLKPEIHQVVIGQAYQDGYYLVMIYSIN